MNGDPAHDYISPDESQETELERLRFDVEQRLDELEKDNSRSGGIVLYVLGMTIACNCSWQRNASILWAILHGLLSWVYVIYYAITR
jgi:hypothetical protein